MIFKLSRDGLVFLWRVGTNDRQPLGLRIKPASQMLFSERNGAWKWAVRIGPAYLRTYARADTAR